MLNFYEWCEDLEIELSSFCNAKCPLCYRNNINFRNHYPRFFERDFNELKNQLDMFTNVKWIRLVGTISEPTLYSNFLELCKYCVTRNWNIEICTNGDTNNEIFWKSLGKILRETDKVFFTICGSTQETHEIYRKGTNLNNILLNASYLRQERKIDYAQIIRFSYNSNDIDSIDFKNKVEPFTHKYYTETFLRNDTKSYVNQKNLELLNVNPNKTLKYFFAEKMATKPDMCICKAFINKWAQIDLYGNIYPCYRFLEFSNGKLFDGDYNKIFAGEYESCKFCRKNVLKYIKENDLEYII